ncbi:MAG: hypothetical protein ACE14T_06075 [Syntrophales bacterium]
MKYDHTQKSPLFWIIPGLGIAIVTVSLFTSLEEGHFFAASGIALAIVLSALCFGCLTVRDEGKFLAIRFGPIPVFRTRIPFSEITEVDVAYSDLVDGWGIHWVPGRGVIYNVWGFNCVRIVLGKKTIRVGTDDVEGLIRFLKTRVGHRENPESALQQN